MAPQELKGLFVALITPFTADGAIDDKEIHTHVNRLIDAGVHGLVPGGSSGEFTTLSIQERKHLIDTVAKAANGRVPFVAGVGALNTPDAIDLAKHHAQAGASALMVLPPFYDPLTLDELRAYFKAIYDATNVPILYYNIPGITNTNLSPKELSSLHDVGVKYLKDTSGNAPALTELLLGQDKIVAFNGWDTLTFYGLVSGANGSVWGATNVFPELSVDLWNAIKIEGDLKRAQEVWAKIWPICSWFESVPYCAALKAGMELRGWSNGVLRQPVAPLSKEKKAELAQLLKKAGVPIQ